MIKITQDIIIRIGLAIMALLACIILAKIAQNNESSQIIFKETEKNTREETP